MIKNKLGAIACWLLRQQFSPLDLLYVLFLGLAYRDFGLLSSQFLMVAIAIASFAFLFDFLTAEIRLSHLMKKLGAMQDKFK